MIKLDQVFYGRDSIKGYRLLASSNPVHNQVVERLCAAIGTPDGKTKVEPFYINHIENDCRYMIFACSGTPDDDGRETLFFHAYVGRHQDLTKAAFGIGNLIQEKAFSSAYQTGPVLPADFEEIASPLPWGKTSIAWDKKALAIQSSTPELPIITGLLKSEIDDVSWASFTFRPLDFCRLYIISEYVMIPRDRKCVSTTGKPLNSVAKSESSISAPRTVPNPETKQTNHENEASIQSDRTDSVFTFPKRRSFLVPFCLSLVLNLILAGYCFVNKTETNNSREQIPVTGTENDKNKDEGKNYVTREDVINELRKEFEKTCSPQSTREWLDSIQADTVLRKQYSEYEKKPLLVAKKYLQFINLTLYGEREENTP